MSYQDTIDLAANTGFRERVQVAVLNAAINVMSEARSVSGHDEYYTRRAVLAYNMIYSFGGGMEAFVWAVATNPAIATTGPSAPDGDLDFMVASIWDAMADVTADLKP